MTRWRHATIAATGLVGLLAACSLILDRDSKQCETRDDCVARGFTGTPVCEQGVCVATNLGPEGCFLGTPTTPEQFANQCTAAQCEKFDNCARLGLCNPGEQPLPAVTPPDAGSSTTSDATFPTQACVEDPATTIVVTGSSAVSGFLQTAAPLVAATGFRIAYQPSGSCVGVDQIFSANRTARDRVGTVSLLFPTTGTAGVPCTWGAGATVDVGVSDVFSTSCNPSYTTGSAIADFVGPVQPMTFVVPATSKETVISAEMGSVVFGRGSRDPKAAPWTDPNLYFVRSASSGTQQMLARAIGIAADKWWGKNAGGTSGVVNGLQSVVPSLADSVIGILSTDALKSAEVRRNIRVLAFQDKKQLCGFYPDRIPVSLDKQNVRDGHYPIWGPVHFYTQVSGGQPTTKVAALVTRFSLPSIDQVLLDAIIAGGLVPQCAMKVARDTEMGPLEAFSPPFHCGCYFESKLADNSVPPGCLACTSTNNCTSDRPACNLGFCETR
jgi:ABC-type phosphate transport system substrate-binding protein